VKLCRYRREEIVEGCVMSGYPSVADDFAKIKCWSHGRIPERKSTVRIFRGYLRIKRKLWVRTPWLEGVESE